MKGFHFQTVRCTFPTAGRWRREKRGSRQRGGEPRKNEWKCSCAVLLALNIFSAAVVIVVVVVPFSFSPTFSYAILFVLIFLSPFYLLLLLSFRGYFTTPSFVLSFFLPISRSGFLIFWRRGRGFWFRAWMKFRIKMWKI